jgi:hypothetical protein
MTAPVPKLHACGLKIQIQEKNPDVGGEIAADWRS